MWRALAEIVCSIYPTMLLTSAMSGCEAYRYEYKRNVLTILRAVRSLVCCRASGDGKRHDQQDCADNSSAQKICVLKCGGAQSVAPADTPPIECLQRERQTAKQQEEIYWKQFQNAWA